jgi:hypothetical protein
MSSPPSPFDPQLGTPPVRPIRREEVVDLLQVTHASEQIHQFRSAMLNGDRFPPISVLPVLGRYILTDGHKRYWACTALGVEEVPAEIWGWGRLMRDLLRQLRTQLALIRSLATATVRGPEGRRRARFYIRGTFRHWRRTALSLWRTLRARG